MVMFSSWKLFIQLCNRVVLRLALQYMPIVLALDAESLPHP